jgi:hypothetical protein
MLNDVDHSDISRGPETCFVDSGLAFESAFPDGIGATGRISSFSPGFSLENAPQVEHTEYTLTPDDYTWLRNSTSSLALEVFRACKNQGMADIAIVAARAIMLGSNIVKNAMCLEEADFSENTTVVTISSGNPDFDRLRNSPISRILGTKANSHDIPVKLSELNFDFDVERNHPSFFGRLRCTGWPRLGYRVFERFWQKFPQGLARGHVLVTRECPLLRETAYVMAKSGYAIHQLPQPKSVPGKNLVSARDRDLLNDILVELIGQTILARLTASAHVPVTNLMIERVCSAVSDYEQALGFWKPIIAGYTDKAAKVVFANAPYRPSDVALFRLCREMGIPYVAFQHGVSKEIDAFHYAIDSITEIASCDMFFSFNPKRAEISDTLEYAEGISRSVGMPLEYFRPGKHRQRDKSSPAIHYYSTLLMAENTNVSATRGASDLDWVKSEISIIREVLAQLPHQVLYKPYPEHRYLDKNPADELALNTPNITVHSEGKDLIYLLPDAELIITSRATSTFSWCLAADKPLVFVNFDNQTPMRTDALTAFEKAVFLFEADSPDFVVSLREFLSQDINSIKQQWQEKAAARKRAFEVFISSDESGAGERAAKYVKKELMKRNRQV